MEVEAEVEEAAVAVDKVRRSRGVRKEGEVVVVEAEAVVGVSSANGVEEAIHRRRAALWGQTAAA